LVVVVVEKFDFEVTAQLSALPQFLLACFSLLFRAKMGQMRLWEVDICWSFIYLLAGSI
jgi:hypothetical protein